jgi:hypothetical protein
VHGSATKAAETSVVVQIPDVGPFVCTLLVIRLVGGYALAYGVWVGAHPDDLQRAFRVWLEPEYENLVAGRRVGRLGPTVGTAGSTRRPGS